MKCYTERMSMIVPRDENMRLVAEAQRRGISLGELIRRATADLLV